MKSLSSAVVIQGSKGSSRQSPFEFEPLFLDSRDNRFYQEDIYLTIT